MKQILRLSMVSSFIFLALNWGSVALAEIFPAEGPPGTTVTISGEGFGDFKNTQDNRVEFQGVPALIQSWEPDFILVKVPLKATSGPVLVMNDGTKREAGIFTLQAVKITKVTPSKVEAGSLVTIEGENFGNTAGSRDPNTMFGVNKVLINGIRAEVRRWRPTKIEVQVPANAQTGDVEVRLASSDPLPDGSCCAPVEYVVSNTMPLKVITPIAYDPQIGPVGSKVVLSGQGFGATAPKDGRISFGGKPAAIAQWTDRTMVVHVPLNAESGPLVLHRDGQDRTIGNFEVVATEVNEYYPKRGPIGTLITIRGKNFGIHSEGGETAYAFDFEAANNGVEIGGIPAVIHRWLDHQIDVWVPFSAKSGPIVVKRGGGIPNADGTCCERQEVVKNVAGEFTVVRPEIHDYSPKEGGLDEIVTIKGSGFGEFLKISESTRMALHHKAHSWKNYRLGEDVSRTEVFINGLAAQVVSWSDTEIQVRIPRRQAFGFGTPEGFENDLMQGTLLLKRGSWDMLENGNCCKPKQWITVVGGPFKMLRRGLPDMDYWNEKGRAQ
ncbi:MAG: IPT/TIG domain-containing protein [Nitrospirota bacterium]|nr:MAG: IPT/TIG domain-containing protein [Nitrospirota bacterium]